MLRAVLLVALAASTPGFSATVVAAAGQTEGPRDVALLNLAAVRRLVSPLTRLSTTDDARLAASVDIALIAEAVLGRPLDRALDIRMLTRQRPENGPRLTSAPGVAARDATAYAMLGVGYSARETADVVNGRISLDALDNARRMRAAGLGREVAANYLDGEYQRLADLRARPVDPGREPESGKSAFDPLIERYARAHGVEPAVIHAIIEAESAYAPRAMSRAGAIGLMQLMPTTAMELGVNPYVPEQNIEGGIRYFASLLRTFGRLDLALVAYNGGPGYASRYARGQAVLYGETRAYVKGVLARLYLGRR